MGAEGRVLEEATERVERELRKLIDEAAANKLATPLPARASAR